MSSSRTSPVAARAPREARDVMAFGQELGRVLSDGRIVGRAEPFAKVFPSSRAVKRAVGLAAWGVLEDIALDAQVDDRGRLVAETNVRRIAANLGLNKDTVTRHLRTLREYGFVLQEEERGAGSGRWETCRYVLDPKACVERFTHTPTADSEPAQEPCPDSSDTVPGPAVSEGTGHGGTGHGDPGHGLRDVDVAPQEQQHATGSERGTSELAERLRALGVVGPVADDLVARHDPQRLRDVCDAAVAKSPRNPAAWAVAALRDGWDLTDVLADLRAAEERRQRRAEAAAAEAQAAADGERERASADVWAAVVFGALDDEALDEALRQVTAPAAALGRRSVPLARAQLLAWAATVLEGARDGDVGARLVAALTAGATPVPDDRVAAPLPDPPSAAGGLRAAGAAGAALTRRIAARLPLIDVPARAVSMEGALR